MRLTLILVLVFGGGLALGWLAAPTKQPEAEPAIHAVAPEDTAKLQALEAELRRQESERGRIERNNQDLSTRIEALLDQLSALQLTMLEVETRVPDPPRNAEAAVPDPASVDEENVPWRGLRPEQIQQREEMRVRFEDRMRLALDEQVALLDDPDAVERLDNLLEWRDYQQEIRQQLREAESDSEREALLAEIDEAQYNARRLVNFEQDSLLRGLATEFGVKGSDQDLFVNQLRETLQSPFFTMERRLTGGAGGFGRGSWGPYPPRPN